MSKFYVYVKKYLKMLGLKKIAPHLHNKMVQAYNMPIRSINNWSGVIYKNSPSTPNLKPPMNVCPETKLEFMHSVDYSGLNHTILIDKDIMHPSKANIVLCRGVFTSSPLVGKLDENWSNVTSYISNYKFSEKGHQFFYAFKKPRWVDLSAFTDNLDCMSYLEDPLVNQTLNNLFPYK